MSALPQPIERVEPLTYTVEQALAVSNLGRTYLYQLIAEQKLASVVVGRRRLINAASLRRLLETGC